MKDSFHTLPLNTIDSDFKEKCNQLISAIVNYRKYENIQYINTRSPENFLTYFDVPIKKATYHDFPENCNHIKIAYQIYSAQGNNDKDSTAIGRKIKKMYIMVI